MKLLRAPEFWWHRHASPPASRWRRSARSTARSPGAGWRAKARRPSMPVICVGNLVVGGAGKTPTALEVANVCRKLGLRPGFLTRGYRGKETGPLFVSPAIHSGCRCRRRSAAPRAIRADRGRRRPAGGREAAWPPRRRGGRDGRWISEPFAAQGSRAVVVDGARGVGNGFVFPAGPLRAPLAAQIRMADALVVLGDGSGRNGVRIAARAGRPTLRAHTEPARRRGLKRRPYLAFAGIADPRKFHASLAEAGADDRPHDGLSRPPPLHRGGLRSDPGGSEQPRASSRSRPRRTACA